MRADGRLPELPVIVISALDEIDSVVRCIQLGAVDYLPKPFNATLLRARVSACLEQKALRDAMRAHLSRLESELDAARKLQMSMVPGIFPAATPERPIEIFATMEPAREVGGDLYDFFPTEDGRLAFAIGDVSGKGVAAAMHMARTKNLLRVVSGLMQPAGGDMPSPAAIVARVNQELCDNNDTMMFVTLIFGVIEPKSGEVQLCNAGHDPPYRLSRSGVATVETPQGMALGIDPSWRYETAALQLLPGEALYFFTDGITEAMDSANALFAKDRLEATLSALTEAPLDRLLDEVGRAVRSFAEGCPQADDITSLVIRRLAAV